MGGSELLCRGISCQGAFGGFLRRLAAGAERGRIHSIYDQVVNVVDSGQRLYTIGSIQMDNGFAALRTDLAPACFTQMNLEIGERLAIQDDRLLLGHGGAVSLQDVVRWSRGIKRVEIPEITILEENAGTLKKLIRREGTSGGCRYYYDKREGERKATLMEKALALRIEEAIGELDRVRTFGEGIIPLIGFGIGLTPSGDDFVTGMLAIFTGLENSFTRGLRKRLRGEILLTLENTSAVGKQMLAGALKGVFREGLLEAAEALTGGAPNELEKKVGRLLATGATSGTDLAVGMGAALDLVIDNWKREDSSWYIKP